MKKTSTSEKIAEFGSGWVISTTFICLTSHDENWINCLLCSVCVIFCNILIYRRAVFGPELPTLAIVIAYFLSTIFCIALACLIIPTITLLEMRWWIIIFSILQLAIPLLFATGRKWMDELFG